MIAHRFTEIISGRISAMFESLGGVLRQPLFRRLSDDDRRLG
jgi:hypothetical protein